MSYRIINKEQRQMHDYIWLSDRFNYRRPDSSVNWWLEHLKLDIQGHVFESRSGPLWYLPSLDILCCANPSSWQDNSILSGVTVFEGEDHLSVEEVTEVTGTR